MRRRSPERISKGVLAETEEIVTFMDMELVITKEDNVLCSLLEPLGYARGLEGEVGKKGGKEGREKSGKKRRRAGREEDEAARIPSLAKSKAKATELKEGRFFLWVDEIESVSARPAAWRVSNGSVAVRWSWLRDDLDNKAIFEAASKRGVVPYFEEDRVIILEHSMDPENDKRAILTFPTESALQEARKKMEFAAAAKAAEESAQTEDQQLTSTLFGNLASSNLSPPKKRYVNDLHKAKEQTPAKDSTAETEKKDKSEKKEDKKEEEKKLPLPSEKEKEDDDMVEVDAEAFVTAIFSKAVRGQAHGEILEKAERMTRVKMEELEDSLRSKSLRKSAVLYGSHSAKEMTGGPDDPRRKCSGCGKRPKTVTAVTFSEPAPLDPSVSRDPSPPFRVHFVCPDPCFRRLSDLLDLVHFSNNCMNRVRRRWALVLADEEEVELGKRRTEKALFQHLCADAKLRAGLHKSYLDLVQRCTPAS